MGDETQEAVAETQATETAPETSEAQSEAPATETTETEGVAVED